jgi:hypothetical protein
MPAFKQPNDSATLRDKALAMRVIVACTLAFFVTSAPAFAECVTVKYRGSPPAWSPVCLDTFKCTETPQSSFVREICYDAKKSYMLIKLNETWYHYCSVDSESVAHLIKGTPIDDKEPSVGRNYNKTFRSHGSVHGPFDCRDHPVPAYPECSCKAG